jgi:hypothetical protein
MPDDINNKFLLSLRILNITMTFSGLDNLTSLACHRKGEFHPFFNILTASSAVTFSDFLVAHLNDNNLALTLITHSALTSNVTPALLPYCSYISFQFSKYGYMILNDVYSGSIVS